VFTNKPITMLTKNVQDILNVQVEKEGFSSSLYLAMASWAESEGYAGISTWLYAQAEEEHKHMLKLLHYINDSGGHAVIPAFKQPPVSYASVKKMFEQVYAHEQHITAAINEIVAVTIAEKDYTTNHWVQWYVNEQIEEEKSSRTILDKLKLLGNESLYIFDRDIVTMRAAESTGKVDAT
jgi:ferritin